MKRALSTVAGDVIPPARAREAIRAGARRAVERARAGELRPYRGEPAPYEIEVDLRKPPGEHLAANLSAPPRVRAQRRAHDPHRRAGHGLGFRRIAYLGYGNTPGMVRY